MDALLPPAHERKRYAELPASSRAEALSLSLGYASVTVPAAGAGAFSALGDLHLGHAQIEPGGADERNLGRLLSGLSAAACPRLRRLRLQHIAGLDALRLDAAGTLEELRLDDLRKLALLELDAPGLRALRVAGCYDMLSDGAAARISAPRLETLACATMCRPDSLRFHGAASVRAMEEIELLSHAPGERWNAGAVGLLRLCTAADSLKLSISPYEKFRLVMPGIEEMMSHLPKLRNITNLTIDVGKGFWHQPKATMAGLIAKCSLVECLCIDITNAENSCLRPGCMCKQEDDPMISLEHLREAKFTGFRRSSEFHKSLVQLIISSAPALERMTIVELIQAHI